MHNTVCISFFSFLPGGNRLPQKTAHSRERDLHVQSRIPGFFQVLVEAVRREGKEKTGCGFRMWLLDSSVFRSGVICLVVKCPWRFNAKLPKSKIFFAPVRG